jgi:hypothetical protein
MIFATDFGAGGAVVLAHLCASLAVLVTTLLVILRGIILLRKPAPRSKRVGLLLILAGVLLPLMCWAWSAARHRATQDFDQLLAGSTDVSLVAIEIEGQGRRVSLNDANSMKYLSEAFRKGKPRAWDPGSSYYVRAELSTGRAITCGLYLSEKKDRLTVLFPIDAADEGTNYLIPLPSPIPEQLAKTLDPLRSGR